jgi:Mn-dependent DtxR family transcriptional regulator
LAENRKKEEKAADSPSQYKDDIEKFQEIAAGIRKKYKLSNYDLIDLLLKKRIEAHPDMIPVSIFDNKELSCLEAIAKYMKENLYFGSGKIAKLLNRNISTISSTYLKAKKKMPSEFVVKESKYFIPLTEISNRKFSVLESIVKFLKEKCSLGNNEIAKLLKRDSRTIWTVYARARKKEANP